MVTVSRKGIDTGPLRSSPAYLGLMTVGIVLMYTGLRNQTIADFIRSWVKLGALPGKAGTGLSEAESKAATESSRVQEGGGSLGLPAAGTATGRAVAQAALSYVGKVPYKWAGETPAGWDCSGMVSYILHNQFGIQLPDNTHTVTSQFYVWSGAATVANSEAAPGDLACWVSHIGICIDKDHMVNAANPMQGTRIDTLSTLVPPVIRRPLAYGAPINESHPAQQGAA